MTRQKYRPAVEPCEWDMEPALLMRPSFKDDRCRDEAAVYWGEEFRDAVVVGPPKWYRKRPATGGDVDMWIDEVPAGAGTRGAFQARMVTIR